MQMANPSKWVQADSSPVEVELETGVVCFNQEGCNLVRFSSFYPGLLFVFFSHGALVRSLGGWWGLDPARPLPQHGKASNCIKQPVT